MNHLNGEKLLDLALDMLGELERDRLLPHLEACDACQAKLVELEAEQELLRGLAPASPPKGLEKRILRRVNARPRGRLVPLRTLFAAAAGVAAVAAGVHYFPQRTPRERMVETIRFSEARALGLASEGR